MSKQPSHDNVAEDNPEFRSVALHSMPAAASLARSVQPELKRAAMIPEPIPQQPIVVEAKQWNPTEVPTIPSFYSLERSHVKVSDASPSTIAQRIVECLNRHSMAVTDANSEEVSVF
jgi:hypothetical protein